MALKGDARQRLEQIKRKKGKNNLSSANVKDLRQIIAKKGKNKKGDRIAPGRTTKNGNNSGPKDLRETNKKLAARKKISQRGRDDDRSRSLGQASRSQPSKASTSINSNRKAPKYPQRQYYVPPHMQQQQQQQHLNQPPTYIITSAAPHSHLAMDNVHEPQQGASVLISNLIPTITQSEIIELFGDIGTLTGVNMINQTTALVSYQSSSDAVRAVKVYHNRFLDGKPMYVNMMPASTAPSSNIRSRIGHTSVAVDSRAVPMDTSYISSRR